MSSAREFSKGDDLPTDMWKVKPRAADSICNQSQVTFGMKSVALKVDNKWLIANVESSGEGLIIVDGTAVKCDFNFPFGVTVLRKSDPNVLIGTQE